MEELAEQLSWVQLERHTKPVVIADIAGFWKPLLLLFAHMRERRFIQSSLEVRYLVAEKIQDIVPMIETAAAKAAVLGTRRRQSIRAYESLFLGIKADANDEGPRSLISRAR